MTRRSRHLHQRFARNDRGSIVIIAGMAFPLLVGAMALGTEAGFWHLSQRRLQQTADLVAYAAVVQLRSGRTGSQIPALSGQIEKAYKPGEDQ